MRDNAARPDDGIITRYPRVAFKRDIGLPIGAQSPAEIAVAILAEVIGTLRSRGVAAKEAAA